MKFHKLRAGETAGTYVMESPVTAGDILRMAQQLASSRLAKGRALTDPQKVLDHLQVLRQDYEHEVFALLLLDTKHRVLGFQEVFRGTLESARSPLSPRSRKVPSQADRVLNTKLKRLLELIDNRTLYHCGLQGMCVVGRCL